MKIVISSAIAIAAATASAPAMAAEGNIVDGFGSFSAGYNVLNPGSDTWGGCDYYGEDCYGPNSVDDGLSAKGLDLNARVSVAVPLGGAFGAQVDGEYSRTVYRTTDASSGDAWSDKLNDSTFAGHVFARNSKGLVGVVAQRTSTNSNDWDGFATYYLGGEAQAYLGRATVYGQVVYASDDQTDEDSNGINAALQLRYFPQDNLKLTLRGGYEFFKIKPDARDNDCSYYCWSDKINTVAIGANAEYRLPGSRISLLGDVDYRSTKLKYTWGYTDGYSNGWGRETFGDVRLMVGVKLNFGAGSLFERDRSGASLDPVRSLGQHAYFVGYNSPDGNYGEP